MIGPIGFKRRKTIIQKGTQVRNGERAKEFFLSTNRTPSL